jgi:hypothetical protein
MTCGAGPRELLGTIVPKEVARHALAVVVCRNYLAPNGLCADNAFYGIADAHNDIASRDFGQNLFVSASAHYLIAYR